jgi:AAA15 family ATPase/GTPase
MILSAPEDFDSLLGMMQRIVPSLTRIRVEKRKIRRVEKEEITFRQTSMQTSVPRTVIGDALVFDFANRKDIPAPNISEGTILLLGLLTVLHSPTRPRTILLDDIEKGLHPSAQRALVAMLREILASQPDLQIVATSLSIFSTS